MFKLLIAGIVLVVLSGCHGGENVPDSRIPGEYALFRGYYVDSAETLTLKGDGTYEHCSGWDATGSRRCRTGRWKRTDPGSLLLNEEHRGLGISDYPDSPHLVLDPDTGVYFEKIKKQ